MSTERDEESSDACSSSIQSARAQVEAARLRRQSLVSAGKLDGAIASDATRQPVIPGYTVLRRLQGGGQGVVYLAIQKSTGRQVAVKVLNQTFWASGALRAVRFEREIKILSQLRHPHIVTIHDCGREGAHFFLVMDYIAGRPLDEWVNTYSQSLGPTLELFAKICDGVNAAHLRGVMHRDLKPANILVDDQGNPRVLDFGLAKLADESDAETSDDALTMTGQFVGSLPWASPEQAEGRSAELDIRTDVYSLGVVFYHCLTKRFPYTVTGSRADVVRHIVSDVPVRPSSVDPRIDRDVETILLKCLAKEPERRYQSANEIAHDIRRYLAGDSIEARRDSLAYVLSKQLKRYRVAASVAAAMLVVVTAALVVSLAYWRQATDQARIADEEAAQARAVSKFMRDVLTSVEPENLGADVRVVQVLALASGTASERFQGHPQQEAQVRDMLGEIYAKLSMWSESKAEHSKATELWRLSVGDDDPRTLWSRMSCMSVMLNLEQTGFAEDELRDLTPRLERVLGPDDPLTLSAHRCIAFTHLFRGRPDEAERIFLELRAHPRLTEDDTAHIAILRGLVHVALHRLSFGEESHCRAIRLQAEPLALEWLERSTRRQGSEAADTLHARVKWADLTAGLGRFEAAKKACREVIERSDGRLADCHFIRMSAMSILADALTGLGEYAEAAELHVRRIACVRQQFAANTPGFLGSLSDALRYIERGGRAADGEALAREMSAAVAGIGGHGELVTMAQSYVANFVSMQNRLDEAEPIFRSLLPQAHDVSLPPDVRARVHLFYGNHLTRAKKYEEAEVQLNTAVDVMGGVRVGTWYSHPDDIILGFVALNEARGMQDKVEMFRRMREEVLQARREPNQSNP